jgi:tRNA dimethylallyltransferase
MEREMLAHRIELRCRQMVQEGLVEEVRRLWDMGYGPDLQPMQTIGYSQMGALLQGRWSMTDALTQMALETKRLAKRQITWLRGKTEVQWFIPMKRQDISIKI